VIAQLAMLAALAVPSLTQLPATGGGQVTISAEKVRYVLPKHRIEYTGNPVKLTRGDSTLLCKRLTAQLDDADRQIQVAVCEGDVRFDRGERTVTCDKATYEEAASRLTCEGDPVIKSGGITARGSLLVYDLDKDEVTMDTVTGAVPAAQAEQWQQKNQQRRKGKPAQARGGAK
jgi:lipopolysaccharide export system protein LptA